MPRTGVWWVYQGQSYEAERTAGIVFAGSGGAQLGHHLNVGRMCLGDVVLHYRRGQVLALGEVVGQPETATRPYDSATERDEGSATRIEYFPLTAPIALNELPERTGREGPFTKDGGAKQGYLFSVDGEYAEKVRTGFSDRWPPGSPWASGTRRYWLFQANPRHWDLIAHLPEMPPDHIEDWTVSRHRADMNPGDGVVLWQGGASAGVYALGRLVRVPELLPAPEFRRKLSGDQEYRVDLVIERHVLPPITREQARVHPVLSELDVLRRPWGGTNLAMTRDQWMAVRGLVSFDPVGEGSRWDAITHWAKRFAESIDFDAEERAFKLEIRDHVVAARDAIVAGSNEWPRVMRRAFGSPNNLTAWQTHAAFLEWTEANLDQSRAALVALWNDAASIPAAIDEFVAALPSDLVSGSGTRTNLASFLLAGRGVEEHPTYKATVFSTAYKLTEWPHQADAAPSARYQTALAFLDGLAEVCRAQGLAPMRDRLDAQGVLWRVISGPAPVGWSDKEVAAYKRFMKGLPVDELAELVAEFRDEVDYPLDGRRERDIEREELAAAFTPEALDEPDVRLLRRLAGSAYGSPGPQPGFNRLLQSEDGVARVTDTLRFLLYGPGEVEQRLDDCIRGEHKLPAVGEAMMVKALTAHDPSRWMPAFVTKGKVGKLATLELLGQDIVSGRDPGPAAAEANDRMRQVLEPHFPGDPWGMQEFAWWLLHREHVPEEPLAKLAQELYLPEPFLARILRLLDDKGQVVFYGPPGTGKTYLARQLAGYIARGGGTVEKVQFHPSYSYEDFVEGYRPKLVDGQVTYEVVDGPLKRIAATAEERGDVTHVLLIDELNRANIAKVLGELLFLLEYRREEIRLQYSDTPFSLPNNLRIIATMNTADRSVALVDTALRRRFHFVPFFPDTPPIDSLLRRWLADNAQEFLWVADVVSRANDMLADRNVAIGPSHFMRNRLTEDLVELTWENSVLPFLEEHFFADQDQLKRFALDRLRSGAAHDPLVDDLDDYGDPSEQP